MLVPLVILYRIAPMPNQWASTIYKSQQEVLLQDNNTQVLTILTTGQTDTGNISNWG
jgi:hypothetical protein